MLSCLTVSTLLFTSTGITFWTTHYMTKILKFEENKVEAAFISLSITAPILGILIGGLIIQKFFGGYESKNSIFFAVLMLILGSCFIPFIYFVDNIVLFCFNLWAILFLGASCIPVLQGISISSLPKHLRSSGNSLYNLIIFAIGFSPGPFMYGFISDRTTNDPKLAYLLMICWCYIGFICLILCTIIKYKTK